MLTRPSKNKEDKPPAGRGSLTQVRLNAFVEGDAQYGVAVSLWQSRIRHDPRTYSLQVLRTREAELAPRVEQLEKLVRFPHPQMDPDLWLEERARLSRLTGQLWAIRRALETGGTILVSGLPQSTKMPDLGPAGSTYQPADDPFLAE